MQEHSRYQELCAAASAGQISAEDFAELRTHLATCSACHELRAEFLEINSAWLTQAPTLESEAYNPPINLRRNILIQLDKAGARFSPAVREEILSKQERSRGFGFDSLRWATAAWAVGLIVVAGAIGFGVGSIRHGSATTERTANAPVIPATQAGVVADKPAPNGTVVPIQPTQTDRDLQQRLATLKAENDHLQKEIEAKAQQIAGLQAARSQDDAALADLQSATDKRQAASASADAQIEQLKDAEASKDAELVDAQVRLRELEDKLNEQGAMEERELQLNALSRGSELRDVVASRNLHIIDVVDVDQSGVRKPFGRVFYTEGKSLIFYAYDLSKTHGKQTFYAWGQKPGDPKNSLPLGPLYNDDEAQSRWVFRFNDNKVLAQIDSVYVTLEPTGTPGRNPKGQKLLSAFLGTAPNHP